MAKSRKLNQPTPQGAKVKVLYQNLNGVWYAFANVGDSVFFGKVPLQASANSPRGESTSRKLRTPSKAA